MHEPHITVTGNIAWPPRHRVLADGTSVADFRVACTPRNRERGTDNWTDGVTMWFGVSCWRGLADNVAKSLQKGDRVVVTGKLATRTWKNESGEERRSLEIDATAIGVDLSRGPVTPQRPVRASEPAPGATSEEWANGGTVDPTTGEVHEPVPAHAA